MWQEKRGLTKDRELKVRNNQDKIQKAEINWKNHTKTTKCGQGSRERHNTKKVSARDQDKGGKETMQVIKTKAKYQPGIKARHNVRSG